MDKKEKSPREDTGYAAPKFQKFPKELKYDQIRGAIARILGKYKLEFFGISPIRVGIKAVLRIAALDYNAEGLPQTTFEIPFGQRWPGSITRKILNDILLLLEQELEAIRDNKPRKFSKPE